MKKTIAGFRKKDGTWEPQQYVDCTPEEIAQRKIDHAKHLKITADDEARKLQKAKDTLRNKVTLKYSELILTEDDPTLSKAKYKSLLADIDAIQTPEDAEVFEF